MENKKFLFVFWGLMHMITEGMFYFAAPQWTGGRLHLQIPSLNLFRQVLLPDAN
jgi:hypothetical protein